MGTKQVIIRKRYVAELAPCDDPRMSPDTATSRVLNVNEHETVVTIVPDGRGMFLQVFTVEERT